MPKKPDPKKQKPSGPKATPNPKKQRKPITQDQANFNKPMNNSVQALVFRSGNKKLIAAYRAWQRDVRLDSVAMEKWYRQQVHDGGGHLGEY